MNTSAPDGNQPLASVATEQPFEFVKLLAREMSAGTVELPSFPEVVLLVQRVLADEATTPDRVVQVIGTEPALASRVLRMANSAALNGSGSSIVELRTAVNRMGFDMLRSVALSFAMAQLRHAPQYEPISDELQSLWQQSMRMGVTAYVVARRRTRLSPDSALLVGILHGVGRLYILARSVEYPDLFADPTGLDSLVAEWHMNVAKVLLQNWGMAAELVQAVHRYSDPAYSSEGPVTLTDVLAAAALLGALSSDRELVGAQLMESSCTRRLEIHPENLDEILDEASTQLQSLLDALQG